MANFNKVILAGNLTRDPQMRYLPSQTPVAEFGMAINRRWSGQDGQVKDEVCFIDCVVFGKQADTFSKYMANGRPVLVEGRLQFDQWEDKEGQKRSKHRVVVERFQFLGGQGSPGEGGGAGGASAARRPMGQRPAGPQAPAAPEGDMEPPPSVYDEGGGETIPF